MTKFELPEKPKKTNTSEDFNNLRKAVDELDKFDYAWKTHANKADRRINAANKYIEELERENQRLIAENLGVETLVDNAKQQRALPVVPEWLDIEIKHFKSTSKHPTVDVVFGVADAIVAVKNGNTHSKLYDYLFCGKQDVCNQHQAIFALAFITGKYQVEKPKLFYLKNKITGMYLSSDGKEFYEHHKIHGFKFTQEDINSLDTGSYEQIEVAE